MRGGRGGVLSLSLMGCSLVRVDPAIEAEYAAVRAELVAEIDQVRPLVEADLQALAAYPWMADRTCVHDASVVLHPLFGFDDSTYLQQGLVARPTWTEADGDVLRDAANRFRSVPDGVHWMTQGASPEVQAVTLPWVASLRAFDCWNITANSPWDQVDPLTLDFVLPRSGGVTLFQASMVLLMQLHSPVEDDVQADQKRILQTLTDVRRIATLTIQSQDQVMARTGANILDREREAVEYLQAQGRMPVGWAVVPKVDAERLRRTLGVAPAFANFFTPTHQRDLVTSDTFAVGRCAGIREGVPRALIFQGLIADEQLQWLDAVLDQSAAFGCHHDDIRALRSRPEYRLDHYEPFDNPLMPPAMRRSNALVLAVIGVPSYVGYFDAESAASIRDGR